MKLIRIKVLNYCSDNEQRTRVQALITAIYEALQRAGVHARMERSGIVYCRTDYDTVQDLAYTLADASPEKYDTAKLHICEITPGHSREQSYHDIMNRAHRIMDEIAFMGWDDDCQTYRDEAEHQRGIARMERVRAIVDAYADNIATALGIKTDRNGKQYWPYSEYNKPVPAEIYRGIAK